MKKAEYMKLMSKIWDYNHRQDKHWMSTNLDQTGDELSVYQHLKKDGECISVLFTRNVFDKQELYKILDQKEPVSPKKMTHDELLAEYNQLVDEENWGESRFSEIGTELDRRNRAAIYKTACKVLKNRGQNQFVAARKYADAIMDDANYFSTDHIHEIGGYYTKSGNPVEVFFED